MEAGTSTPPRIGDAVGEALTAWLAQGQAEAVIERDDGLVNLDDVGGYFARFEDWPEQNRRSMDFARGRVLDIGCGPGRVALHLQGLGHEVVAVDVSPGAVEVARRRGVRDARLLSLEQIDPTLGSFDTIAMLGSFPLVGEGERGRERLRALAACAAPGGRLIAESIDPYATEDPAHLRYQERNRRRGHMPGCVRMRVRFRELATPWLDLVLASPEEVATLAQGSGWHLELELRDTSPVFIAILERDDET